MNNLEAAEALESLARELKNCKQGTVLKYGGDPYEIPYFEETIFEGKNHIIVHRS